MDTILDSPDGSAERQQWVYGAVWQRAAATLIDFVIFLAVNSIPAWTHTALHYTSAVLLLGFGLYYYVYLAGRYGATPGKMLVGLKIVRKDGADISLQNAMMRYAVMFAYNLFMAIPSLIAMDLLRQHLFTRTVWATEHLELLGVDINIPGTLFGLWYVPNALFVLFHPQRRALHDFIANTVVIRKNSKIPDSKSFIH